MLKQYSNPVLLPLYCMLLIWFPTSAYCDFNSHFNESISPVNIPSSITVQATLDSLNEKNNTEKYAMEAYLRGLVDYAFVADFQRNVYRHGYCFAQYYEQGEGHYILSKTSALSLADELLMGAVDVNIATATMIFRALSIKHPCRGEYKTHKLIAGKQRWILTSVKIKETLAALAIDDKGAPERRIMESYIHGLIDFSYVAKLTYLNRADYECLYDTDKDGNKKYFKDVVPSLELAKKLMQEREYPDQYMNWNTATLFDIYFRKKYQCDIGDLSRQRQEESPK